MLSRYISYLLLFSNLMNRIQGTILLIIKILMKKSHNAMLILFYMVFLSVRYKIAVI